MDLGLHSIQRALISVSDKSNLLDIAHILKEFNVEIVSTGGTGRFLEENGFSYTPIEQVTGVPEALGGRVKTLSHRIFSGILFRRSHEEDEKEIQEREIPVFDLIINNLYPFQKVHQEKNLSERELLEWIDIGGISLLRAAAKNYPWVTVLSDPSHYQEFIEEMTQYTGKTSLKMRKEMALKTFKTTTHYDSYILKALGDTDPVNALFLDNFDSQDLRYGENPHQKATLFSKRGEAVSLEKLKGEELSYNNFLDLSTAMNFVSEFSDLKKQKRIDQYQYVCVVVKHQNICGMCMGDNSQDVLEMAWKSDEVSAFGCILLCNFKLDASHAIFLQKHYQDLIMAKDYTMEAMEILEKKKKLKLMRAPENLHFFREKHSVRSLGDNFFLTQEEDNVYEDEILEVTKDKFPEKLKRLNPFGILVTKYLKSNGVSVMGYSEEKSLYTLLGTGSGIPNRVKALSSLAMPMAVSREDFERESLVLFSDAFFPFPDSIEIWANVGGKYVVAPKGSIRDHQVITRCNELGVALGHSNRRHFRH